MRLKIRATRTDCRLRYQHSHAMAYALGSLSILSQFQSQLVLRYCPT